MSTKKLKSMVGIDPIIPFIQKIKAQFDKNSILTNEVPKGYLLVGHPGTGKTLLAKVIAGETEARLFPIVASEFFLAGSGIGTIRLREFFQEAKQNSPSIIFIDEIDSIGGVRSGSMGNIKSSQFIVESPSQLGLWKQNPSNWVSSESPSSHRVKSNPIITNEFLIQMDGFSQRNSVILIGVATIRELFGAGTLMGYEILPLVSNGGWYMANNLLLLPPSSFIIIGLFISQLFSAAVFTKKNYEMCLVV